MARTKSDLDRKEKEQEILGVARRLFVEIGYDVSVNRVAEEAGVAPNTLYWYFADKDALLIAVLDQVLAEAIRDFGRRQKSTLDAQVVWLLGMLEGVEKLITTVHARAALSDSVSAWHTSFHRMLEAVLVAQLRGHGVGEQDLEHAARVAMFVVEGLLAHPTSTRDRRSLVRWLIATVPTKGELGGAAR